MAYDTKIAASKGAAFVVITGGEPLHHNLEELCKGINKLTNEENIAPIPIHLETSGVNALSGTPTWITLSPKRHSPPCDELLEKCDELKLIVHEKEDLIFAEKMAFAAKSKRRYKKNDQLLQPHLPLLFLQPGWESKEGKALAMQYVLEHSEWRLSLQTHKWLGIS